MYIANLISVSEKHSLGKVVQSVLFEDANWL